MVLTGITLALSACGTFFSALLWRNSHGQTNLPGCGEGSGCDDVIRSRWSRWLGLPICVPATITYFALTVALVASLFQVPRLIFYSNFAVTVLGSLLGWAALWFMWLQWKVVRRFCIYCTFLHLLGLIISGLVAVQARHVPYGSDFLATAQAFGGAAGVCLIAGQVLVRPKLYAIVPALPSDPQQSNVISSPHPSPKPTRHRQITLLSGAVTTNVYTWPCLGTPDAKHVIACLFDYTCPTCRQTHGFLSDAAKRYPGQVAFVLLPIPMDPTCNRHLRERHHLHAHACKFARLALLLWQANPLRYDEFDRWVFQDAEPPPIGMAIQKVKELLGTDDIDPARPDGDVDPLIFQAIDWYKTLDIQRIPTLLFPKSSLKGQLPSAAKLCQILEQEYPLHAPLVAR